MVPEIAPVPGAIVTPGGSPPALQVRVSPSGSDPGTVNETTSPSAFDWLSGDVTDGARFTLVTVQVKVSVALLPSASGRSGWWFW